MSGVDEKRLRKIIAILQTFGEQGFIDVSVKDELDRRLRSWIVMARLGQFFGPKEDMWIETPIHDESILELADILKECIAKPECFGKQFGRKSLDPCWKAICPFIRECIEASRAKNE